MGYFFQIRRNSDSRVKVILKPEARFLFWPARRKTASFEEIDGIRGVLPLGDLYLVPVFGLFGPCFEVQDAYGNYAHFDDAVQNLIASYQTDHEKNLI